MRHSPGRMAERESTLARARLSKLNTNRPARSSSTQASGIGDITSTLRDRWAEVGAQLEKGVVSA